MNLYLQIIIVASASCFLLFTIFMISRNSLQLRYSLIWLFASAALVVLGIFPSILKWVAGILHIVEPVNALFMFIIFFILLSLFSLTITLSKAKKQISTLTQELALLKHEIEQKPEKHDVLGE